MDPVRFAEKVRELMEYHNFILTNLYQAQPVDVEAMIEETLDAVGTSSPRSVTLWIWFTAAAATAR